MKTYDSLFDVTTVAEVASSETNMSAVIVTNSLSPTENIKEVFDEVFDLATEQKDSTPIPELYFDRLGEIQDQIDTDSPINENDRSFIVGLYMLLTS